MEPQAWRAPVVCRVDRTTLVAVVALHRSHRDGDAGSANERKVVPKRRIAQAAVVYQRFALGAWLVLLAAIVLVVWKLDSIADQNHKLATQSKSLAVQAKQLSVQSKQLALENKRRLKDIQRNRVEACQNIYNSFHIVFDPFLPPPDKQTPQQKAQLAKFNRIIDTKVRECSVPPKPKEGR